MSQELLQHSTEADAMQCARLPLSFAQERLWFLHQLEPGSAGYNVPGAVLLRGALDVQRLEQALNVVIARHENLRTLFSSDEGQPYQQILDRVDFQLERVDLSDREAREEEAKALCRADAAKPFDLARGPLLRGKVIRLAEHEHVLMLNMHHIISDGWSIGVLLKELRVILDAYRQGREPQLPALPIQYADYAVWQRQWLEEEGVLAQQLAYWQTKLADAPESLDLAFDFPRPDVPAHSGGSHSFAIDVALTAQFKRMAEQNGATLFMALLSVFKILIHRYTGQGDLCVGTPIANRQQGETEGLIGLFINTLALRTRVEPTDTFATLLSRVKATCLEAYENQDAPFEKIVDALRLQRNLAISPLFQVMLVLQNTERVALDASIEPYAFDAGVHKFDLTLDCAESIDGLSASIRYSTALYEPQTIARFADHFVALIRAILASPATQLQHLDYLSAAEKQQLLAVFNGENTEESSRCLHDFFVEQAARHGDRTAVICGDERLTYQQLEERSRALALVLLSQGIGPDSLVGLCVERSLHMVVGLLGILRAGGAYVPLDPDDPDERIAYKVSDSRAAVVLTQSSLKDRLRALIPEETQVVALDVDWPEIAAQAEALNAPLTHAVAQHNLAYVIYTSGSTGQPKGVMVEHRQVVRYATSVQERLEVPAGSSFALVSTFAADLGNTVLFPSLMSGGTLHVLTGEVATDPRAYAAYCRDHRIDCMKITPSHLQALVGDRNDAYLIPAHTLVFGGELLSPSVVRWVHQLQPACRVFNHYGPTECTVGVLSGLAVSLRRRSVPLGAPLVGTRIYVVDPQGQPVPVGVPGELLIGGAQVTRGYLNRPELTAERFVADRFSTVPGARVYKTGDTARWCPDGTIEYLGRNDFQVKIRGFRVEPGEIEAQLVKHAAVKEALVLAREDEPGDKRLIAYVTLTAAATVNELRAHLQARVSQAMVPSAFVILEAMPLTPNGKVDRKALPRPEAQPSAGDTYEPPQGAVEERLSAIWQDLLGVARVGRTDNFFELGGHSLLATRLMSKIRTGLGVDLPLRALFEGSTVAQLAASIAKGEKSDIPAIPRADRSQYDSLPLSFAQERLWFLNQLAPNTAGYNISRAVKITGAFDVARIEAAFNVVIARHENLRTVFPSVDGEPRQRILETLDFRVQHIDLTDLPANLREVEARRLCETEAATPFDLAAGPLLRCLVIALGPDEHILMMNLHHIISDGWSHPVLMRELRAAMANAELPPLPIQYADYGVWQRQWLQQSGVLERQLGYWQQKLAGVPERVDLPTDFPRPSVQTYAGANHRFALDAALTARLRQLGEREGATLYMVLLAAFKALVYRYTEQSDLCVGSPIANRQYGETEALIGMFVNTLAMRSQVDGSDSFAALLAKVKTTCLEAYEHQDAPFERVVDALQLPRNLATTPLFQAMLVLQNNEAVAIDGSMEPYLLETCVSKFDLTWIFAESAGGLTGFVEYNTDLYKEETIARMTGHFAALCEAITSSPAAEIGQLEYLGAPEKHALLLGFNDTAADYQNGICLHELFEEQAVRSGEDLAILCGDERLTYRQLDQQSRQLAVYLQSQGVGPDQLVGVCMERSPNLIVSLLAVLRAGGAYVPLDPDYPTDRLAYMVRDSRAAIVLTQESLLEKLGAQVEAGVQLLALDRQWPHASGRVLQRDVRPHHLSHIIYTSGSTGQPKGVAIEHHSSVTLVQWGLEVYSSEELSRVLASTSICFDLSVYEIFLTLANGGTIQLVRNALALADGTSREGITLINTVPSAIEELVRLGAVPTSVQTINLAGEPLPARLVDRIYETTSAKKVYDLYGPSEDTTYSTYTLRTPKGPQTIGRPLARTKVYILDRRGRLQPIGVPGELHIAGDGLARGYLYRPELTEQKFIPNPFEPGTRMYKTGDLARWTDAGTLQYLGRIDTQVKVRGFRIEMGEIEARLGQHDDIQDAAVIAQGEGAEKQLIAFYRAKETTANVVIELPAEELRDHLLRTLPAYMVPAAFVSLGAIPLSPNGKVDRRALARIDVTATASNAYAAPRNETETELAALWAEVLNVGADKIGIHDDFFERGGHSLLATRLIAKIRSWFGVDLPLKALFESGTVAQLANRIAQEEDRPAPAIVPADRTKIRRLPLSYAQERLWFLDQLAPNNAAYNIPTAMRIRRGLDLDKVEAAFQYVIARHEMLRTIFPSDEGLPQQKVLDSIDCKLRRIDLRGLDSSARDAEGRRLCAVEAGTPFDLAKGPLIRGTAITLADDEYILMLTLHHIISDGWSHGILIRELGMVVTAFNEGRVPELRPLPIQYADYSVWQRRLLEEEGVLDRQLAYWKQKLAGAPEMLDLPTDFPRPNAQTFDGSRHFFSLDGKLIARLKK
ncbi:MAG: amino acid adenylation domain-containing protein, partial [Acidobacteria bacterium]|nr:amino acid adenylation domain-containing protein [Acidobacteriota bacterium]